MVRLKEAERLIAEHSHLTVMDGPFRGMRYVESAFHSGYATKLLGSYEAELHPFIEEVIQRAKGGKYSGLIDIGAAEGYYAIGLARCCPTLGVVAFEMDETAVTLCLELARRNEVEARVEVRGTCDIAALREALQGFGGPAFVLCDVEGDEIKLLDPTLIPELQRCDLLVELHDFSNSLITPTLLQRFQETHDITHFNTQVRRPHDVPAAAFLPAYLRPVAVDDMRAFHQSFLWLSARSDAVLTSSPTPPG
ncbi:hypothetical protein IAD21_00756 [Abditibacteriota bacterium]|nr:hypothetical protein IAD21_00756 [Abditibacteriota bacterium]